MTEELLNIPRIYTAIAEFLFALLYIAFLKKRVHGVTLFASIALALGVFIGYHFLMELLPLYLWIPGMAGAVGLMFLFIYLTTKTSVTAALFFTAHAFILAEFSASLEWQLYYYFIVNFPLVSTVAFEIFLFIVVYAGIFLSLFALERRYMRKTNARDLERSDILYAVGISTLVFALGNLNFVEINTPFTGRYPAEIFYIRTLVLLLGIILLYAQREHRLAEQSKLELGAVKNIMKRQYDQYKKSQNDRELIHQKYHDLKHNIHLIKTAENPKIKEDYISQMEKEISTLKTDYNTGNEVLDTVLASKAPLMHKSEIYFTCVANGELLNFMSVLDQVSLFGNALDNAIEAVNKIEDPKEKIINLSIYNKDDFLMIRIENTYKGNLQYENGKIVTTKEGDLDHGFGISSIRSIVQKHGGTVHIDTENQWFELLILIPIPKNQT